MTAAFDQAYEVLIIAERKLNKLQFVDAVINSNECIKLCFQHLQHLLNIDGNHINEEIFRKLLASTVRLFKEYEGKYVKVILLRSWLILRVCEELLSICKINGLSISEILDRTTAELLASAIVKLTKTVYWDMYRIVSRIETLMQLNHSSI